MLLKTDRVDVNNKDWHGFTALSGAAKGGKMQAVKVLLEHPDVDTMATDYKGRTAYDLAVENGHHEIASLLATSKGLNYGKQEIPAFYS